MMRRTWAGRGAGALALSGVLLSAAVLAAAPAGAHEEHGQTREDAGPAAVEGHQHGGDHGHLPASSSNVDLVGKLDLTDVNGGIADVAAFGRYAYLGAFHPECLGRNPGSRGGGVHVVDIADPEAPRKVAFLPAEPNSYVGEGVHVIAFEGRQYLLHNNETCDGNQPVVSGISVWDVTDPAAARKVGQYGDRLPAQPRQTFHTTHSVQGFVWQGRAYAVASDNQDLRDVDILDLTPALRGTGDAVLVAERGLEDWPGAQGSYANGDSVFHHDAQQKVVDGRNLLAVSYWDAGQVLLDASDPSDPQFVTDSDFPSPDSELPQFQIPEGNSHQSYFDQDGDFLLSSDEDFSATRTLCQVTTGPQAGATGCGEFGFTKKLVDQSPAGISGRTVFGGSGCIEDLNGNGTSDRAEVPPATGENTVVVFSRGGCFFSDKVRSGEEAGYPVVAIGNSHGGSRRGLLPDAFICGSQGSPVLGTASAICLGHRAMHELFADDPAYVGPEGYVAGGDLPPIGTVGETISARGGVFDGWGYVRLHDARSPGLPEIDSYAVAESKDPSYAEGFGNLTVHEVKTDSRPGKDLAYLSYYDAGLRVLRFGADGMEEVGHYIAEGGNDFWGVFPVLPGQVGAKGKGKGDEHARPLRLIRDRDSGLWVLRYTGKV